MENVVLKKSKIHGNGVFANRDFKKEETILLIDDSDVVTDTSKLTEKQLQFDCDFLANGKVVLMKEPERSINHSCDPNTYVKTINGIRHVLAMKGIRKGEEVTYDYAVNGDNEGTFICHCGSKNCRKVYQGNFFKLPKEIQIKYLPFLEDWFAKQFSGELEKLRKVLK